MSLGIVMLVHNALDRAEQVARHWSAAGCPVVIHVDRRVPKSAHDRFRAALSDRPDVLFSRRHACEWGRWGLVAATLDACALMLERFEPGHVYLTSGACLPLRPVAELRDWLAARPRTDFIESATVADVPWTVGGLQAERMTLYFPVSWRRRRRLFDALVQVQRALRIRRTPPRDVVPHIGSQWWCLTARTLRAILKAPDRAEHDRFFRSTWIPDESYFQSLVRLYSTQVQSRSLTLSKFDFQGKPHVFYDDHLQLLSRSDCFVARKIWPRADRLYETFIGETPEAATRADPNPAKIDRVFSRATDRRLRGRAGLYMHSRFPSPGLELGMTAAPYSVFCGFDPVIDGFRPWIHERTGAEVHGHLFAPERAEFAAGATVMPGALTDHAAPRDANPRAFLASLIWNTRGTRQCFQYGPRDTPGIAAMMAYDTNAQISVVTGAWALALMRRDGDFDSLRIEAARLQAAERAFLNILRNPHAKARIRIWSLAEFLEAPLEPLQTVVQEIGLREGARLDAPPPLRDRSGFAEFLQRLRNAGMHPYLIGDMPPDTAARPERTAPRRRYVVP